MRSFGLRLAALSFLEHIHRPILLRFILSRFIVSILVDGVCDDSVLAPNALVRWFGDCS